MRMSDILVFITATINCGQTPEVKRTDPHDREQDYLRAFEHLMSLKVDADIIFCENSNANLASFHNLADYYQGHGVVRFLSFNGNSGAEHKGKGYGELEMLRHAFEMMPEINNYRYIVKVSGRYLLKNANLLIDRIRKMSVDLICDIHVNLTYGDTRTVAFTPQTALTHLIPYQEELDELRGITIEHLMAKCLHRTVLAGGKWTPLPCTPICDGISGSWNTPQRTTPLYLFKQGVKRKLAKWIYRY